MTHKKEKQKTMHFIGIGGIGMSGIARLYLSKGVRVQGSDLKKNDILSRLESSGAQIFIGHNASYVDKADCVIYSSSIPEDHVERLAAVKKGIPALHRAQALAELCREKFNIAVTGTHGKTTTTSLVGMILKEAGNDPSIVVGGVVAAFGGNACLGRGPEIVIEADESDSSFLYFSPSLAVITNIEEEHLDHFKNIEQIERAYRDFLKRLKPQGVWFGCAQDPRILQLAKDVPGGILYGFTKGRSALAATDIVECPGGRHGISFRVWHGEEDLGEIHLKILGRHNVLNALAAIGVGLKRGVRFSVIASALSKFEGAARRFDVKYQDKDYTVVDDYAHHPTEIQKTLEAAKALGKNRIVALFQPHRYSRTEFLMCEFGKSFQNADKLIVTDIYAASEKPRAGISGKKLCEEVNRAGHPDAVFADRSNLYEAARGQIRPGDLVIAMGAGDIDQVARQLSDYLDENQNGPTVVRGKILKNEPMGRHTSLKIGGPAEYWVEPEDEEDLKNALAFARKKDLEITLFGAGSNLLPPDEGLKGMALHLGAPYFRQIRMQGDRIVSRAGVPNALFIQFALEQGFGGFEFLLGIPGNIGGALAMNAGSHGQSLGPFVESVITVRYDGARCVRAGSEIPFAYRHCGIQNEIIVEAVFNFKKCPAADSQKILEEYRQYRARTQDLRYPSAGCMFKNPDIPNCSSGQLIDEAGLKGLRIGNAQVSEKHANFIVNLGGATAKDITQLIEQVRQTVKRKFNIELEAEVRVLRNSSPAEFQGDGLALLKNEKIAVLAGGDSCEREISLISGKNVFEALTAKGLTVLWVDPAGKDGTNGVRDLIAQLKQEKITLVFIALHGTFGEDGAVQRLLEKEGIAYTGPGIIASELAFDKTKTQALLQREGILIPDFFVLSDVSQIKNKIPLDFPLVVKPAESGSSVGVTLLAGPAGYEAACREAFRYSKSILIERFIAGRELTVGVLGEKPLPVVEVVVQRKFYDYKAKYQDSSTRYEVPAKLNASQTEKVTREAMKAYQALGCRMMSRVDIILAPDDKPYVLEVNTIPGLTAKSLLPKAAQAAGVDFPTLCVRILTMALSKNRGVLARG